MTLHHNDVKIMEVLAVMGFLLAGIMAVVLSHLYLPASGKRADEWWPARIRAGVVTGFAAAAIMVAMVGVLSISVHLLPRVVWKPLEIVVLISGSFLAARWPDALERYCERVESRQVERSGAHG